MGFKKRLHLGVLARLKVLILLAFVIVVGCWQAFVGSFDGEILGWPFLTPFRVDFGRTGFIMMFWTAMFAWAMGEEEEEEEEEEEKLTAIFDRAFGFVAIAALILPILGVMSISSEAPQFKGTPEKRGSQYVLMGSPPSRSQKSYVIREISKQEYELFTTHYVRQRAFGWMIFHEVLILFFLYCHYQTKRFYAKNPAKIPTKRPNTPPQMGLQEAIEAIRTDSADVRAWLVLGQMMALREREHASECYERALELNLLTYQARRSVGDLSGRLLPRWIKEKKFTFLSNYSSHHPPTVPLPSWLHQYEGGSSFLGSYFSSLQALTNPFALALLLTIVGGCALLIVDVQSGELAVTFLRRLLSVTIALLALKQLANGLHFLKVLISIPHWPQTEAIVIDSYFRPWKEKRKTIYTLHVVCAYKVKNQIFYSTVPSINSYRSSKNLPSEDTFKAFSASLNENYFRKQKEKYGFGKRIILCFNPTQPEIFLHSANLDEIKGHLRSLALSMMMAAFFFCILSYLFLVMNMT